MSRSIKFSLTDQEQSELDPMFIGVVYDMIAYPDEAIPEVWQGLSEFKASEFQSHHCSTKTLPNRLSIHRQRVLDPETLDVKTKYHLEARFDV